MKIALFLKVVLLALTVRAADSQPPPPPPSPPAASPVAPTGLDTSSLAENESNWNKLIAPFNYDRAEHPRDPFRLPELALEPLTPGPYFGPFLELNEISLDKVKVQGIILDVEKSRAIISYDNGDGKNKKTYTVRVGDALGENFGRVQSIRDGKITILQTLEENGALRTTTHVLSIRKYNLKTQ